MKETVPSGWTWGDMGWPASQSIPRDVPDNSWSGKEQVVLVDSRGRPILKREPRLLGFRPPKEAK